MTCQCSTIEFGTVGEVLDRDSLKVIDPSPDRMVEPSGNSFINLNEV